MPRDISLLDAYVPTLMLLFILGAAVTWVLDSILARLGVYRVVWHHSLFRVCLLVCVCCLLGLTVYH